MQSNEDFRKKFYKSYFAHQASRSGSVNLAEKLLDDHLHYRYDILPHMPEDKGSSIVEIACGYGSLLKFLVEKGYTPKGFDLSVDQIGVATELGLDAEVKDIGDWIGDSSDSVDVLLAIDLIEHFDKPQLLQLLIDLRKKVKAGGVFIARTPNMDGIHPNQYAFGDFTHGALLNPSSAIQLFKAAGFSNIQVLDSCVKIRGAKEMLRVFVWGFSRLRAKVQLFGSGRSTRGVVLTPNIVIVARP